MPESESTIAIDGPGAVGKTTVGRMLSDRIGFLFIDTGVMYRAVTAVAIQRDVDTDDEDAVTGLCKVGRHPHHRGPEARFPEGDSGRQ